jgi:hypothetical protein
LNVTWFSDEADFLLDGRTATQEPPEDNKYFVICGIRNHAVTQISIAIGSKQIPQGC